LAARTFISGSPSSLIGGNNLGNIFATIPSNTFTAGVPNNKDLIMGVTAIGNGLMDTCVLTVKPGSLLYFSELVISSTAGGKNDNIILNIKGKQGPSGWINYGTLNVSTTQPVVSLHQGGFPNIMNPFSPDPMDVILTVRREGGSGTTDNIGISVFMTAQLVEDLPV